MIQQTVDRLLPLASASDFLIITNDLLQETIRQQLPQLPAAAILREPAARNTAPACAIAAFLYERSAPETILGVFPSDHVVTDEVRFREVIRSAIGVASAGEHIVVLGVPPTRPETGFGYIRQGSAADGIGTGAVPVRRVQCFTEKPDRQRAEEFLRAGNYAWNSGIFLWSAGTLANAIRQHCPQMVEPLERIARSYGTADFEATFAELYPTVDSISIDYAVLEPRSARGEQASNIFCLPADFGWSDLGSWNALHEFALEQSDVHIDGNVVEARQSVHLESSGNYVFAPNLTVALVGVQDLVVVQTDDALLITTREHSQQVGRVVQHLRDSDQDDLL